MLDALTQAQIWQAGLSQVRGAGFGVLVISHGAALLDRLCGRVVALSDTAPAFALAPLASKE